MNKQLLAISAKVFLSGISLLLILILFPSHVKAEDKIVIGLLPEMNVFKQKQRFIPLAEYLSEKTGVKVELTLLSRYGNIIQRFKEQKVDAAFLGSFTGALAISQLNVVPLARPMNLDGTSTYHGHIFTRKDSGINTVADMKGKTLALVERATTAGYVFPLAYFKRFGVHDAIAYFSEKYFVGSHDAAVNAVLNGDAQVGAAKNTVYDMMMKSDPRIEKELTILASSTPVPSNGLCVRHDMSKDLQKKLQETLLVIHEDPAGIEVLKKLGALRFVKTSAEDYQPVIDLATEAGINMESYHYYNP